MKIRITFKDPDGVSESINDLAQEHADKILESKVILNLFGRNHLVEKLEEKITEKLEKFITYREYLTVEFDLEAGTATVIPANQ